MRSRAASRLVIGVGLGVVFGIGVAFILEQGTQNQAAHNAPAAATPSNQAAVNLPAADTAASLRLAVTAPQAPPTVASPGPSASNPPAAVNQAVPNGTNSASSGSYANESSALSNDTNVPKSRHGSRHAQSTASVKKSSAPPTDGKLENAHGDSGTDVTTPSSPPAADDAVLSSEVSSPEVLAIARDISKRFHLPTEMAQEITREAYRAADLNEGRPVEATLVLAVIAVESSYRPTVINRHTGATGLMQVTAKWHQDKVHDVGGEQMLLAVAPNIQVGTAILAEYLGRERGRIDPALGRYWGSAQADQYVQRVRVQMRHLSNVAKRATTLSASTLIASR